MSWSWSRIVMTGTALALSSLGAAHADEPAAGGADSCIAAPSDVRIQVLVELADAPSLRVYESARTASTTSGPAVREEAARASERAQDARIKEAQAAVARELAGLGARELYRVRRSFNGIAVLVSPDKLSALRSLSGVKAIYPRVPEGERGSVRVAERAPGPSAPRSEEAGSAVPAAGLRAYVDPRTGQLTSSPTDAQADELERLLGREEALNRSSEGLEVVTHADGTRVVDLQGRFQNFSLATVSPDGAVKLHCNGHGAAAQPLRVDPASAAPEKE